MLIMILFKNLTEESKKIKKNEIDSDIKGLIVYCKLFKKFST